MYAKITARSFSSSDHRWNLSLSLFLYKRCTRKDASFTNLIFWHMTSKLAVPLSCEMSTVKYFFYQLMICYVLRFLESTLTYQFQKAFTEIHLPIIPVHAFVWNTVYSIVGKDCSGECEMREGTAQKLIA